MSTPANRTTRASQPGSAPSVRETSYLSRPGGRIGYDVAGDGLLVVLMPGMGDLRAGYRFLAPDLRAAGYRVACTDLRGHGGSDATFTSYGDEETAGDLIALIEVLGGPGPGITRSRSGLTSPPMLSCVSWNRSRAVPRARLIRASRAVILIVAAGKAGVVAGGRVRGHGPGRRRFVGRACACPGWLIGMTAMIWGYRP